MLRKGAVTALEVAVVVVLVSLVAGQALGYPVLLGFVETGSMEPTLEPGDGFVAVPKPVAGPIEPGTVIVFQAEQIQGGGLTTHRVVEETERGYITRGDANPFTDQDGEEPPVKRAQIVAVALQVGGEVVVVPELGTAVTGVRGVLTALQRELAALVGSRSLLGPTGVGYVVSGLLFAAYLVDLLVSDESGRERDRGRDRARDGGSDVRLYVAAMALVVVLAATAAMVVPAGPQEYGIVSAEFASDRPTVIPAGESKAVPYPLANDGLVPTVVYVESASQGVAVDGARTVLGYGGRAEATVTLRAPPETGYYRRYVVEHRYLAILPVPVIDALHGIHPWLALAGVNAALGGGFYLLGRLLLGSGRVRRRSRSTGSRRSGGFLE
jgi:signal peptidase